MEINNEKKVTENLQHNPLKEELIKEAPEQKINMPEQEVNAKKDLQINEEDQKKLLKEQEKQQRENAFREKFQEAKTRKLSTKKIKKGITFKSETRVTKKHLIKKDETENVKMYLREEENKKLEEYSEKINKGIMAPKDIAANFRMDTSIEIKSKCGFENFTLLSKFYPGIASEMKPEEYRKLVSDYGKDAKSEGRFAVMDTLTTKIMGIDTSQIDLSTDSAIVEKCSNLEALSSMVESYKELLSGNPAYKEKLKNTKENGVSNFELLAKKLEVLSAMSDYYRIRKMILTDPEYISSENGIDEEITEKDGKATTRLKEMMRASYLLADNLNRVAGLSGSLYTIELPELSEGKTKEAKKRFKKIDDCIKAKKGSSALSESWEKQYEKSLVREAGISDLLRQFEEQGLSVSTMQMRNDFKDLSSNKAEISKLAAPYSLGLSKSLNYLMGVYIEEKRPGLQEKISRMKLDTLKDGTFLSNSTFPSKKYPMLEKLELSDNLNRSVPHLIMRMMDKSDAEIIEFIKTINTLATSDYLAKKDNMTEEEFEFYEDRYADVANETLFRHNALVEKTADAYGMNIIISHPSDYAWNCSDDTMATLGAVSVNSNILQEGNDMRLLEFASQYQKDKKHKNYKYNQYQLVDCGDALTPILFKNGVLDDLDEYLTGNDEGRLSEEELELYQEIIGDSLSEDMINEWAEKPENKKEIERYAKLSFTAATQFRSKLAVYLIKNPSVLSKEMLEKLPTENFATVHSSSLNKEKMINAMYEYGLAKPPADSELKKYEKSMKDRKLLKINYKEYKNEEGSSEYELISKDPYHLKLFYDMNKNKKAFGEKKDIVRYEPYYDAKIAYHKMFNDTWFNQKLDQRKLIVEATQKKPPVRPGDEILDAHKSNANLENASGTIKIDGLNISRLILCFQGPVGKGYDSSKMKKVLEKLDIDHSKKYDAVKDAELIKELDDRFLEGLRELKEMYYNYLKRLEATYGTLLSQLHPETILRMMNEDLDTAAGLFLGIQDAIQLFSYAPGLFDFEQNEEDRQFKNLANYYNSLYQGVFYKYCVSIPDDFEKEVRLSQGVPKEELDKIDDDAIAHMERSMEGKDQNLIFDISKISGPHLDEQEQFQYYDMLKHHTRSHPEFKNKLFGKFAKNCTP